MSEKEIKNRLFYLIQAISWLDDVRRGLFTSPDKIDRAIKKSDLPRVKSIWKKARKELRGLTGTLGTEEKIRKYAIAGTFLRIAAILSISIFGILFINAAMNPQKNVTLLRIITNPVVIILFIIIIPNAFMIVDYFARHTVREKMVKLGIKEKKRIKDVINELLKILAAETKRGGVNPKKLKFRLFFNDYEHVKILKKPGLIRKSYEVIPKN